MFHCLIKLVVKFCYYFVSFLSIVQKKKSFIWKADITQVAVLSSEKEKNWENIVGVYHNIGKRDIFFVFIEKYITFFNKKFFFEIAFGK
jgi:hypothetical protein